MIGQYDSTFSALISCNQNCNDPVCQSECLREYDACEKICPCEVGCPGGCPCVDYQCEDFVCETNFREKNTNARITEAELRLEEGIVIGRRFAELGFESFKGTSLLYKID